MTNVATYDEILCIYLDERDNSFYDAWGNRLDNIYDILTPNDLLLFRDDPGYCIFPHRYDRYTLCEIDILE